MGLLDLLPAPWADSPEVQAFQAALQPHIDALRANREDFLRQMSIRDATWGLDVWERATGIEPDLSKSLGFRRARVMARLRGRGTTTVGLVRSIADSYADLSVTVEELPAEYRVAVRLLGVLGTPANAGELETTLREVMPAHLAFDLALEYQAGTMAHLSAFLLHRGRVSTIQMEPF